MKLGVEHIFFRYHKNSPWIFEDFSISFNRGITLIKGFSGCGKSTLLRLLAGYLYPDQGAVIVPFTEEPNADFKRKHLGFLFQQLNLLPLASVERNLQLAAGIAGIPTSRVKEDAHHWLQCLGLWELRHKKPAALSGGQQQRAALTRALIKAPSVLLLDEPTSGLDDKNTAIIRDSLASYASDDRFIIISTHDPRLDSLSKQVFDFNQYLPLDPHLEKAFQGNV